MGKYILRRILYAIPVLFAVIVVTFGLIHALPGGPFDASNQRRLPPHIRAQLEQQFGLNKPVFFNLPDDGKGSETAWGKTLSVKGHSDTGYVTDIFDAPDNAGIQLYGSYNAYELVGDDETSCIEKQVEPGWALIAERKECIVQGGDVSQTIGKVEKRWSVDLLDSQFWQYFWNVLHLDFGPSLDISKLQENKQVADEFRERVPISMQLGIFATLLGFTLGIPLGVTAAVHHNSRIDSAITMFAGVGLSIPTIVLAPILIVIFAVKLELVPVADAEAWREGSDVIWPFILNFILSLLVLFLLWRWLPDLIAQLRQPNTPPARLLFTVLLLAGVSILLYLNGQRWITLSRRADDFQHMIGDYVKVLILPLVTIAIGSSAGIARMTRANLLEVLGEDYILTARSKGLQERQILFIHALKNSLIPVATAVGPLLAGIVGGSFIIELIFSIPGMGSVLIEAVGGRDYSTIMGVTIFYSTLLIFGNIITDILYTWLDPRIRYN